MPKTTSQEIVQQFEQDRQEVARIEREEAIPALRDHLAAAELDAWLAGLATIRSLFANNSEGARQIANLNQCIASVRAVVGAIPPVVPVPVPVLEA